jgi:hypothetical protein
VVEGRVSRAEAHLPGHVARGVVAVRRLLHHYKHAPVAIPDTIKARRRHAWQALSAFVERTYATFSAVPAKVRAELSARIAPRLAVIQHSIRQAPSPTSCGTASASSSIVWVSSPARTSGRPSAASSGAIQTSKTSTTSTALA